MKRYIDIWINKKNPAFGDISPINMADEDKSKVLDILSSYQYPGNFPVEHLMHKLGIEPDVQAVAAIAEDTVTKYLDRVIALDFASLRELTLNNSPLDDIEERYAELVSSIPSYKKIKKYSFIHSGLSEDGSQCIVFVELNHRDEFCFLLRQHESEWYIRQAIAGNPSLYFKQNQTFERIAAFLAEAKAQSAYAEILEALRSYPDSSDLYYYRGLYWLLSKDTGKARTDFFNAISLDNGFAPPYMHLGIVNLNEKDYNEAELWFAALVALEPQNLDAANNLGIAFIAKGEKDKALKIWKEIIRKDPDYEMAKKNLELYG